LEINQSASLIRNEQDEINEVPAADVIKQNKKSIIGNNQTALTSEVG
jgi:hypothetical protein